MFRFPSKQIAVTGEAIEYVCAGRGPAVVVLVNGSGGPIEGWHKVFGPLATFARVFAYNRPGIGNSSKPSAPQLGSHMVASLRATLLAAGLPPPYILVGHSLGGLIVNLFARLHPAEVEAVVMLEATAPDDVAVLATHESALQTLLKKGLEWLVPANPNAESQHMAATVSQVQAAPSFPAIPLSIVTGGKPAMQWATAAPALAARSAHQRALLDLSPMAKQIMATRSGHFPQFSEPELVVAAIKEAATESARMMDT
ncbi:alpha/beta fold hydrolase [Pseudomonas sp.]|uniref:alpha/beta fold hydrolase n=1 Tax=Pseudomonas sp. TaxID=306 RepID=UPI003C769BB5